MLSALLGSLSLGMSPGRAEHEDLNKHLNLSAGDSRFVTEVAKGNESEIKLGQLGVEKAASKSVREFAAKLVADHTKAAAELKSICDLKGITLKAGEKSEATGETDFSQLSGEAFDQAFVKHLVRDHEKDIKEFEKESTSGEDRQIREYAARMLPTLNTHLAAAKALSLDLNASLSNILHEPAGAAPSDAPRSPKGIEKKDNDARGEPHATPAPSEQK